MHMGIGKTKAGLGGYVPQVNLTGMDRLVQRRLFFSRRESALLLEKTVRGGFGNVDIGTIMGVVAAGAVDTAPDRIVPYTAVGNASLIGKSMFVADAAAAQPDIVVSLSDSYRFIVGDRVVIYNSTPVYEIANVAVITRGATTAAITLSANVTAATFTTALGSFVAHRTGAAAADATSLAAAYVLDQDIYTGEGPETIQPDGALASVVVSNAVLYVDCIDNANAAALVALSMVQDGGANGRHYIMR